MSSNSQIFEFILCENEMIRNAEEAYVKDVEKQNDIRILNKLGAKNSAVKILFFKHGMFITLIGGGLGVFLGISAVYLQESLGIIHLSGTQIPYPVSLNAFNLFVVFGWVLFVGIVGSSISLLSLKKVTL